MRRPLKLQAPGACVHARLVFVGRLDPADFAAFARDRAARLSLKLTISEATPARFLCELAGHPALIEMFEMACSLGPMTCVVLAVAREEA